MTLKASALPPTLAEGSNSNEESCDLFGNNRVVDSTLAALLGGCGCYATATFMPAAAEYLANDIQDTAKAMTWYYANGVTVPATAIIRVTASMLKINTTGVTSGMTSFGLGLFKAARATPLADNTPFTCLAADIDSYMDVLSLGTPADVGGFLFIRQALSNDYQMLASGMVAELITNGAHTPAAITEVRTVKLLGVVL